MRLGKIGLEHYRATDKRGGIGPSQLMCNHPQQMKRPRVLRIGIADNSVKPFRLVQAASAMVRHRRGERLFETASGIHREASKSEPLPHWHSR
jgi:hypothetical protein